LEEMQAAGIPAEAMKELRDALDCNLYFFDRAVPVSTMYLILGVTVLALIAIYIGINGARKRT